MRAALVRSVTWILPSESFQASHVSTVPALLRPPEQIGVLAEDPLPFCGGEIRVRAQSRFRADHFGIALVVQSRAAICGPTALPYNRGRYRRAGRPFPQKCRFPLIRDPDRGNLVRVDPAFGDTFGQGCHLRGVNVHRILLDPAGLRIDLSDRLIRQGNDPAVPIKEDRPRACGAFIESEQILFHGKKPPS